MPPAPRLPLSMKKQQSGVVLLVTLVALVIVLIGAIALMRSSDTSSVIAGNLAFKRDLTNNAERAIAVAINAFAAGGQLNTTAATLTDLPAANYSATTLPSSIANQGIPDALFTTTLDASKFSAGNITDTASGIVITYVIDRMCSQTGAVDPTTCLLNADTSDLGGTQWLRKAGGGYQAVYRVSVRVSGPRETQAFVQSTLSN